MAYTTYSPHIALQKHIDAYWMVQTGALVEPYAEPIFPDGCTDIIVNVGYNSTELNGVAFKPGNAYLAGTMTRLTHVNRVPHTCIIGIRFKPGGLSGFYQLPLPELTDQLVEFTDKALLSLLDPGDGWTQRLDRFFTGKMTSRNEKVMGITHLVYNRKGQITVDELAKNFHISNRTLERLVKNQIGISPKELTGIIRFQHALQYIRAGSNNESLLRMAFDTGYYDHAHLTHAIKKYTGLTPSQLAAYYKRS
jgi:AraC-like DNA-binding protein